MPAIERMDDLTGFALIGSFSAKPPDRVKRGKAHLSTEPSTLSLSVLSFVTRTRELWLRLCSATAVAFLVQYHILTFSVVVHMY
jgi:hypothetical protein